MARKVVRCFCGFVGLGEDDELVVAIQVHVRESHNEELSPADVLAMAEPEPSDAS